MEKKREHVQDCDADTAITPDESPAADRVCQPGWLSRPLHVECQEHAFVSEIILLGDLRSFLDLPFQEILQAAC